MSYSKIKKEFILFDLDGTLVDSKRGIFASARFAFEKMGWPLPSEKDLIKFIGPPLYRSFSAVDQSMSAEEVARAVEFYRSDYNARGAMMCRLYDGIEDMLNKLKAEGYKLVVATAKSQQGAETVLEYLKIDGLFDFVSGAPADKSRNEKDEIIAHAVKEVNIPLKRAVMVGDRRYDAEGAAANQIDFIGAGWGYGGRQELFASGATVIADTPDELPALIS